MSKYLLANSLAMLMVVGSIPFTPAAQAESVEQDALGQGASPRMMVNNESDPLVPDKLFGTRGGYVHPFISVTALLSDNINNSTNEVSDWQMIYSPGIWLAAPASKEIILNLNTDISAPGGLLRDFEKTKRFGRYQTYAMYVADINDYLDHSGMDNVKQSVEGFFQINLRSGLSIDFFDRFTNSHDPIGSTDSTELEKYKSNLLGVAADYDLTEKVLLRADYTNLDLNYDRAASGDRDRTDNAVSGYLFYKYSEKTSLFTQYKFVDLSYESNKDQDNTQHYAYVGMDWRPTGKTTLKGKVGVAVRDATLATGDNTEPVCELTADYKITGKTTAQLSVGQRISESTFSTSDYSIDKAINLAFQTQFTSKISGRLLVGYRKSDYEGGIFDRDDDINTVSLVGTYALKEWLKAEAGYQFTDRDSSRDLYDYSTNELFVRLSAGF